MSDTGSTGDRPTMAQAFSSAPDSPTGTPAVSETTPAGATDQTTTAQTTSPASDGPIPLDRHKAILDGIYKERDGYKQQLDALSWAQGLDRQAIHEAQRIGQLYQTDRIGYLRSIIAESLADQELAPLLRSEAARVLAGARGSQADPAIEPDIPVYDANNQLVSQTYSAERVKQIVQRAVAEAIGKEVTPIKQTFADQQARAKAFEQRQQALQKVDAVVSRLEKLPLYKEHVADIAKAMDLPEFADLDPIEQAYAAYHHVTGPKLQQTHQAQALATLEKQAAAAQVNPNAAVVTSKTRPASLLDKSLQW